MFSRDVSARRGRVSSGRRQRPVEGLLPQASALATWSWSAVALEPTSLCWRPPAGLHRAEQEARGHDYHRQLRQVLRHGEVPEGHNSVYAESPPMTTTGALPAPSTRSPPP